MQPNLLTTASVAKLMVPPKTSAKAMEASTDTVPATPTDKEVFALLAAMRPTEYDRVRKDEAKRLGIQVKTLDDEVKAIRAGDNAANHLPFDEIEPHPEPVDPALVFNEVAEMIKSHVVMDDVQADTAALWCVHTYLTGEFDTSPLAIVNAPEKECAKTLLQTVLSRMCYRPLPAANASSSALFRAVELWGPTIFFDEADTFFRDKPELHGMVNAGYKNGGFVLRSESVGDTFEPRMFSVYSAKSIAGIALEKHLPESTMSRGIVFNLRRKMPHEKVSRLRYTDPAHFDLIASKLARFAADYSKQIRLARPSLPRELGDRAQDNWEPLLAIAECAGPAWVKRATEAALVLSRKNEEAVSTSNELLADIQYVFESKKVDRIRTADLIAALIADEEKPWATFNRGNPLSPRQLCKQLAAYDIKTKTVRFGPATPKGFELSQFQDAFARYLSQTPPVTQLRNETPEPSNGKACGDADETQQVRPESETPAVMPTLDCGVVAAVSPHQAGGAEKPSERALEDLF